MTTPTPELVRDIFLDAEVREQQSEFGSLMSGARADRALGFVPEHFWRDDVTRS